jgi:hypothetical protein
LLGSGHVGVIEKARFNELLSGLALRAGCIDLMGLILTTGLPFVPSSGVLDVDDEGAILIDIQDKGDLDMRLAIALRERGCGDLSGKSTGIAGTPGTELLRPRITVSASAKIFNTGPVPEPVPEPDERHDSRLIRVLPSYSCSDSPASEDPAAWLQDEWLLTELCGDGAM